ncbi:MAG TPA: hypothetical protein VL294_11490 [Pseudolysinimonas sp.]|nr:hypothetical protein [Pseudolysinimonas sp.]
MSQSFLRACLLILAGVVALWIALELLARFWMWIALIGALILGGYIAYRVIKARKDQW